MAGPLGLDGVAVRQGSVPEIRRSEPGLVLIPSLTTKEHIALDLMLNVLTAQVNHAESTSTL